MSTSFNTNGRLRPVSSIQFTSAFRRPSTMPAIRSTSFAEAFRRWPFGIRFWSLGCTTPYNDFLSKELRLGTRRMYF